LIDRQEVMDFSREFGLAAQVIEKDYTLGWLLAGIAAHSEIGQSWIFKGGTCLKKCYFETYRFSEDLDFTLTNPDHINEEFLLATFAEIAGWVYDQSGIEIPADTIRFEIYENPRGKTASQGRIGYRGPMQRRGDAPRIKLDLTDDEILVLEPVMREVHHPYSDRPDDEIHVLCYSFEEVFAEKIRALVERLRPRDLYDVVDLFRRDNESTDRELIVRVLEKKCAYKSIEVPTIDILTSHPEMDDLKASWNNMLAHQLPALPSFDDHWDQLPDMFDWLYRRKEKKVYDVMPDDKDTPSDSSWKLPPMAQAWHTNAPLEIIRFAAAKRLCVDLKYKDENRLVEPYSIRKTENGDFILYAVRHEDGQPRSYRVDRIQGAAATNISFSPRYTIELTASGPLHAPETERVSTRRTSSWGRSSNGPTYVVECPYCDRTFRRKINTTTLKAHKDKDGFPCSSRHGYLIDTIY